MGKKYMDKTLDLELFGIESNAELCELVDETVKIGKTDQMLQAQLPDDTSLEHFVKLTEQFRRSRSQRIEAGDETAALPIQDPAEKKKAAKKPPVKLKSTAPAAPVHRGYRPA